MENDLVLGRRQMYKSPSDKFSTSTSNPIQKIEHAIYSRPPRHIFIFMHGYGACPNVLSANASKRLPPRPQTRRAILPGRRALRFRTSLTRFAVIDAPRSPRFVDHRCVFSQPQLPERLTP